MSHIEFVDFSTGKTKELMDNRHYVDREDYAQFLLSDLGFDSLQTKAAFNLEHQLKKRGHYGIYVDFLRRNDLSHDELIVTGVPDLIVFNDFGVMFVEVKSYNGGLRKSQVEWMLRFEDRVSVKILYIK